MIHPFSRGAVALILVVFGVGAAGVVIGATSIASQPAPPWDPLGEFPTQTVDNVTAESVEVTGTKCYDEPVEVIGSFWWQTVDPPGTIRAEASGQSDSVRHGCITSMFVNLIPDDVREADAELGGAVWMIAGVETPIDEVGGRQGVPHQWRTEPFRIPS